MPDVAQVTRRGSKSQPQSGPTAERIAQLVAGVRAHGTESRTTVSPLTGADLAVVPVSTIDDVDAAFAAARAAQRRWQALGLGARKRALLKFHDLVLSHQRELLDLIQLESGKSRRHAFEEVAHTALTGRYYGRTVRRILGRRRVAGVYPILTKVRAGHRPKGVVGIISPWNFPLSMGVVDGLAAIAAGNAVVQKPDSQSPLTMLAARELMIEAGIPADLWQIVSGTGSTIGTAIIERADYICFTGSTTTGRLIAQECGDRLIGCSLELGGKNPMIVLPGANVDRAAAGLMAAAFTAAGQLCVSVERAYVHDSLYDAFRDAVADRARHLSLGTALDWEAEVGTLVSPAQLATVEKHVEDAVDHGATVVAGGRARPDIAPWCFEPTILENVPDTAICHADETFGPLVSLYRYGDVEDAVRLANDTVYGLNASVWGPERLAEEVAGWIEAGTVNINEGFAATFGSIGAPMGGVKQSGTGRRQGPEGLLRFTESQSIATQRLMPVAGPPWCAPDTFAKVLTIGLRLLRWTGRA